MHQDEPDYDTAPERAAHPNVTMHPVWVQAAHDANREFDYGDTISMEWIHTRLEIDRVQDETVMTFRQHKDRAFELLRKVDEFKNIMLRKHRKLLVNVRNAGYRIIQPADQTAEAMARLERDIQKTLSEAMKKLLHINDSMLEIEQLRENTDARNKVAFLKSANIRHLATKSAPDTDSRALAKTEPTHDP